MKMTSTARSNLPTAGNYVSPSWVRPGLADKGIVDSGNDCWRWFEFFHSARQLIRQVFRTSVTWRALTCPSNVLLKSSNGRRFPTRLVEALATLIRRELHLLPVSVMRRRSRDCLDPQWRPLQLKMQLILTSRTDSTATIFTLWIELKSNERQGKKQSNAW